MRRGRRSVALVAGVLLLAACARDVGRPAAGGAAAPPPPDDPVEASPLREEQTLRERAIARAQLRHARCMRNQGIDFPDPQPDEYGRYYHEPPPEGPAREAYEAAGAICVKHFDAIADVPLTPEEQREFAAALERDRRITQCLRDRGLPWPDPIPGQGAWYDDDVEAAGIDWEAPHVRRAVQACEARFPDPAEQGAP
jgi:hypothetical protein